jgi:two-component system LytT family response regulator
MPAAKSAVPISTLIVDDEELARNLLGTLVRRHPDLILTGECADGAAALETASSKHPDLVFLDIHMPVLNGMAVAEKLAAFDPAPYIIFVTAFDDYAIRAFELNALDYLVKPLEKERFRAAIERATTAIRNKEMLSLTERLLQLGRTNRGHTLAENDHELMIRSGDSIVQLRTSDIVWIEAANQYVHIHTAARTFTASESLSQYSKRINDPWFFRIHRSAIVNGRAIAAVAKKRNGTHVLKLRTGHSLVVARSRASMIPSILRAARAGFNNI